MAHELLKTQQQPVDPNPQNGCCQWLQNAKPNGTKFCGRSLVRATKFRTKENPTANSARKMFWQFP